MTECNTCGAGKVRTGHASWCWTANPAQPDRGLTAAEASLDKVRRELEADLNRGILERKRTA